MGLYKLVENLYLKVFVGISVSRAGVEVDVELGRGKAVKERASERFESEDMEGVAAFLAPYLAESPFHYIAFLNTDDEQGALPAASEREAASYVDMATMLTVVLKGGWTVYASKPAIDAMRKRYQGVGVDFVFSPFIVLQRFFADKTDNEPTLFVLVEEEAVSAAVFSQNRLLFAKRLPLPLESPVDFAGSGDHVSLNFDLDLDGLEEGLELDDINAIDDLEGFDDLHDIQDLDTLDDLDELEGFSDEVIPVAEPAKKRDRETNEEETSLRSFDRDYKRFGLIHGALQEYYSDSRFDSRFIETIYVADGCGLSEDLKHYLEEELFVKVFVRKVQIAAEVLKLAKAEVGSAL